MLTIDTKWQIDLALKKIKREGHDVLMIIFDQSADSPENAIEVLSTMGNDRETIALMAKEALGIVADPKPHIIN